MDKFPVCWKKEAIGELTVERESLYSWYTVRACLPEEGLWSAWLIGSGGELRLGILEVNDCGAMLRRRFSEQMVQHLGTFLRGEVRPVTPAQTDCWEPILDPERHFRTRYLRQSLRGRRILLARQGDGTLRIAVLYDKGLDFPLVELFCFAEFFEIDGSAYLVFSFDREERILPDGSCRTF